MTALRSAPTPRRTAARLPHLVLPLAATLAAALAACGRGAPAEREAAPPSTGERALVLASGFQAGPRTPPPVVRNPYEGDSEAEAQGRRLYTWFNCLGCHGAQGGGGMGPPLRDQGWIYGGDPASVFQSIAQGRPNGMPAFGGKVPDEQIWKLVLFVRSLGGMDTAERPGRSGGGSPSQPGTTGGG